MRQKIVTRFMPRRYRAGKLNAALKQFTNHRFSGPSARLRSYTAHLVQDHPCKAHSGNAIVAPGAIAEPDALPTDLVCRPDQHDLHHDLYLGQPLREAIEAVNARLDHQAAPTGPDTGMVRELADPHMELGDRLGCACGLHILKAPRLPLGEGVTPDRFPAPRPTARERRGQGMGQGMGQRMGQGAGRRSGYSAGACARVASLCVVALLTA